MISSPSVFLQVEQPDIAATPVGGLNVLQRNIRFLINAGFLPQVVTADHIPAESVSPFLLLRGDAQYGLSAFARVREALAKHPGQALKFLDRDGGELPICWCVPGAAAVTITIDVPPALFAGSLDAFFAEILAGTEGWVARGLNKKISFPISHKLLNTACTPNQITGMIFVMGLIGCLLFLSPLWPVRLAGALLVQLNSILDGCDGEIARIKGLTSNLGAWLDTIADDILNNVMLLCLWLGLYRQGAPVWVLPLGIAASLASAGVSFFIYRYLIAHKTANAAHFRLAWDRSPVTDGKNQKPTLFDRVKPLLKRDFFILVTLIFILFDARLPLLILSALPVWIAFLLYASSYLYEFKHDY
jgi:phosphatidylglycerophosphate synthase